MGNLKKMPDRSPINGTFELTGRCNLKCNMCLLRVDKKCMDKLNLKELTANEWINMAQQAKDAGTVGLLLTGGEVMLRQDFCEIYEEIAQMGFLITVYTNATMVTDKIMDIFRRFPPHKIGVTMYGASNETYKKMCGCEDGFDRFVDGVNQLTQLPSLFDMRTTIVKENLYDLEAMKKFTSERFGLTQQLTISRIVINKIRNGIACPKESRLTPEENLSIVKQELISI